MDLGINFRGTAGYVGDGVGETYCLADAYPTTRGGGTFGFLSAVSGADRDSGQDRRLAGINFNGAGPETFQWDLPATGSATVHLGLGDASASHTNVQAVFKDNTATLFTVGPYFVNGISGVADATGQDLSMANWPAQELGRLVTMATTVLKIVLTADANWTIAHLRVVQASVTGPKPFFTTMLSSPRRAM